MPVDGADEGSEADDMVDEQEADIFGFDDLDDEAPEDDDAAFDDGADRSERTRSADAGVEHLQRAAREMIAAGRAFLDVVEELVEHPDAAAEAMGALRGVGGRLARSATGLAGNPGRSRGAARRDASDDLDDGFDDPEGDDGGLRRIRIS